MSIKILTPSDLTSKFYDVNNNLAIDPYNIVDANSIIYVSNSNTQTIEGFSVNSTFYDTIKNKQLEVEQEFQKIEDLTNQINNKITPSYVNNLIDSYTGEPADAYFVPTNLNPFVISPNSKIIFSNEEVNSVTVQNAPKQFKVYADVRRVIPTAYINSLEESEKPKDVPNLNIFFAKPELNLGISERSLNREINANAQLPNPNLGFVVEGLELSIKDSSLFINNILQNLNNVATNSVLINGQSVNYTSGTYNLTETQVKELYENYKNNGAEIKYNENTKKIELLIGNIKVVSNKEAPEGYLPCLKFRFMGLLSLLPIKEVFPSEDLTLNGNLYKGINYQKLKLNTTVDNKDTCNLIKRENELVSFAVKIPSNTLSTVFTIKPLNGIAQDVNKTSYSSANHTFTHETPNFNQYRNSIVVKCIYDKTTDKYNIGAFSSNGFLRILGNTAVIDANLIKLNYGHLNFYIKEDDDTQKLFIKTYDGRSHDITLITTNGQKADSFKITSLDSEVRRYEEKSSVFQTIKSIKDATNIDNLTDFSISYLEPFKYAVNEKAVNGFLREKEGKLINRMCKIIKSDDGYTAYLGQYLAQYEASNLKNIVYINDINRPFKPLTKYIKTDSNKYKVSIDSILFNKYTHPMYADCEYLINNIIGYKLNNKLSSSLDLSFVYENSILTFIGAFLGTNNTVPASKELLYLNPLTNELEQGYVKQDANTGYYRYVVEVMTTNLNNELESEGLQFFQIKNTTTNEMYLGVKIGTHTFMVKLDSFNLNGLNRLLTSVTIRTLEINKEVYLCGYETKDFTLSDIEANYNIEDNYPTIEG